jgi:hypothetical protein
MTISNQETTSICAGRVGSEAVRRMNAAGMPVQQVDPPEDRLRRTREAEGTSSDRSKKFRERCIAVLAALFAVAGCSSPESQAERANGVEIGGALRTDARSYRLKRDWVALKTEIGIRLTNQSQQTMYIVNCRGGMHTPLDKWVDGRWVRYLTPIGADCLSAPIVVEPGATLTRSVEVWGALRATTPIQPGRLPKSRARTAWCWRKLYGTTRKTGHHSGTRCRWSCERPTSSGSDAD